MTLCCRSLQTLIVFLSADKNNVRKMISKNEKLFKSKWRRFHDLKFKLLHKLSLKLYMAHSAWPLLNVVLRFPQ